MGYSTKGVNTTQETGVGSYFGHGIKELMINSFELKESKNGSHLVVLHMETRPIDMARYPKFTPAEGATAGGQIGRVNNSKYYMNKPEYYDQFVKDMGMIADKIGVREQLDSIDTGDDFPAYVNALNGVLTGKFAWYKITSEKYYREGKAPGTILHLGRYSKSSLAVTQDKTKLKFNEDDPFDVKPLETADNTALDKVLPS